MDTSTFTLLIGGLMCLLLLAGFPVAFSMAGVSVLGVLLIWGGKGLFMITQTAYSESTSYLLTAVPLFIFMANILRCSNLADDLYDLVYVWIGRLPGGLAAGTVIICALFAAMAGISSVATISMGMIALPSMLKRGYDKHLATGCISAGGALGILIPPSLIMVIYGNMAEVSIGKLFMGGLLPGVLLTAVLVVYVLICCFMDPALGPPIAERHSLGHKLRTLKSVIMPGLLVVLVLGVIYTGAATPTEAAAVGAFGAFVCALVDRKMTVKAFWDTLMSTLSLTAMVMWIVAGAVAFTHILAYAGVAKLLQDIILSWELSRWWIFIGMQLTFFVLGMFLDPAGIIMLTTPIFIPLVKELGFDPIWFGVMFTINMEMAYLTPPFGFNLFIMKAVVPPEITMADIYRGIIPMVLLQALCLIICTVFPDIALYLPSRMK